MKVKRVAVRFGPDRRTVSDVMDQIEYFGLPVREIDSVNSIAGVFSEAEFVVLIVHAETITGDRELARDLFRCRRENDSHLFIVFVSETDDFETRLACIRAGGSAFFLTPIDARRLIDKFDSLVPECHREPYHVLIIDDDHEQVGYTALVLQQAGMVTSVASDPRNIFKILVEYKPELIVMDMYMPDCTGMELATLIRQQEAFVAIPIVFLSIETDMDKQLEAIAQGADDFLTKPISPDHLTKSIAVRAERTRNMRFFIERDSLTGLLNHTHLKQRLAEEIQRGERIGQNVSFAMIDLDRFKSVNDTYGHLTGDGVLKTLARLLRERLRSTDVIGRYGGEEFGIVFFNTTAEQAATVMDQIRESFSRIKHYAGDESFFSTFSCGIASFPTLANATDVSEASDRALYRAKDAGRNRVVIG